MKLTRRGLLALPIAPYAFAQQPPANPALVLFIGNSLTFYNNMPDMVNELTSAAPGVRPVAASMLARPALRLEDHWKHELTLQVMKKVPWTHVVLQEGSGMMLNAADRTERYARLFDAEIRKIGARTVVFQPWHSKEQGGGEQWLLEAYGKLAQRLGAVLAPVGRAWQIARQQGRAQLFDADQHHPAPVGSYLTACVFYSLVTGQRAPAAMRPGLSSASVADARAAAWQAVTELK